MDFNGTEGQFAILAESLPQLVWSARPDGYHDYFNRRWHEFTGLTTEQSLGQGWSAAVHPDDLSSVQELWREAMEKGQPFGGEYRIRRFDGQYCWMLGRGIPIQDLSGTVVRWFGTCTNIDAQKHAEEALRAMEEQYRLALEAARLGIWRIDLENGVVSWDERTCTLFNLPREGPLSMSLEEAMERIHPDDRASVKERMMTAVDPSSNGRYEAEYRAILTDGSLRWVRANGQAHFVHEGEAYRAVSLSGVLGDSTEQHAAEEARHLLTRELTHRVKNLFAIANGMVSMTARTASDPKEMATALRGRLGALARAHELVQPLPASGHHIGPETGLEQLIQSVLAPYIETERRIGIGGPGVTVGPNTTTSLALVMHELATNAAKYGCLSSPDGALAIRWTISHDTVELHWTETGGPPIASPPSFEGFGSQLAQRSIAGQLGGTLNREWRREGLHVQMIMPLSRLSG